MTELGLEAVEDEVGVLLRDGGGGVRSDVMSKHNVVEGEIDCWTVGEVGDDEGVWKETKRATNVSSNCTVPGYGLTISLFQSRG